MENIIHQLLNLLPLPSMASRYNYNDGLIKQIPKECRMCNYSCAEVFIPEYSCSENKLMICSKGFNYYIINICDNPVVLFGFLVKGKHGKLPRKKKKQLENEIVEESIITNIHSIINNLIGDVRVFADTKVNESLFQFHDLVPTISLIFRTTESLIYQEEGSSFENKVENANSRLKTLYHAISLLDNRLKLMPIINNPEAAKFGQLSMSSPYKIFDKMIRLFKVNEKKASIQLKPNQYITFETFVYDSFIAIPFLLIDNAIKYSKPYSEILVYFQQDGAYLNIEVCSYGPLVSDSSLEKIFEKGFKDKNAQKYSSKGSGIGLYLAQTVAKAHNFEIKYKNKYKESINGIDMGYNSFYFKLTK